MSDHETSEPGQEGAALPAELAPLDAYLLAEGRRWRRREPSTAGLARHVRGLVQNGGPRRGNEDVMLTEHRVPDHTPDDARPAPSRREPSRWRGPLALVATIMLIALTASIFAYLRTGSTRTGSGHQSVFTTPTPGLTRVVAIQPRDPSLHLPANGYLSDLSFSSAHDGWAVGGIRFPDPPGQTNVAAKATLIHYQDGVWTAGGDAFQNLALDGVSMVSATDGWATGMVDVKSPTDRFTGAVLLHYTSGHWTQVATPALATFAPRTIHMFSLDSGYMTGVVNVPSTSAPGSVDQRMALAIYQDGAWKLVTTSFAFPNSQVVMVSASEGWASAMKDLTKPGGVQNQQATIYHYVNGVWTPSLTFPGAVESLSAASRVDVFALAAQCAGCSEPTPRIEHYNGTGWARMSPPDETTVNDTLGFQASSLISQTIYDGAASGAWIRYTYQDTNPANPHPYSTATWREKVTGDGWQLANPPFVGSQIIALTTDGNGGLWALAQADSPLKMTILYTQGMKWTLYGQG